MTAAQVSRTAILNDACRKTLGLAGGRCMITRGVQALEYSDRLAIFAAVRTFDTWTADNDPRGEHDFGLVEFGGNQVFWKIDYFEQGSDYTYGSEDPSDDAATQRVLTIMLASEY